MRFPIVCLIALTISGCRNEESDGPTIACANRLYSSFDRRNMQQCVEVCVKCNHGSMTTCSTSCTLNGAK